MRKTVWTVVAVAIALMAVPASALEVPLIADGGESTTAIQVGTITISDDGTDLTVEYLITVTDPPWELVATHLGVRTATYDGIKVKGNGNVTPR